MAKSLGMTPEELTEHIEDGGSRLRPISREEVASHPVGGCFNPWSTSATLNPTQRPHHQPAGLLDAVVFEPPKPPKPIRSLPVMWVEGKILATGLFQTRPVTPNETPCVSDCAARPRWHQCGPDLAYLLAKKAVRVEQSVSLADIFDHARPKQAGWRKLAAWRKRAFRQNLVTEWANALKSATDESLSNDALARIVGRLLNNVTGATIKRSAILKIISLPKKIWAPRL
ncbi:MAG: hypothetical protein V2A77_01830 [Pseudomonadota bacterium]